MDLIKRHLFFILCGVAGLVGIVLAVTGTQAMPAVMKQMDTAAKLYQDLGGLRSKGANERMLETVQEHIDRVLTDRRAIGEKASTLYPYEPLVPSVFPNGDADARRAFRKAYGEQMAALMQSLNAGLPATPADIQAMAGKISDEAYRRKLRGETEPAYPGPAYTPAGVLTRAGARTDPTARAHIAAAQRIYCYAVDYATLDDKSLDKSSLDFDVAMQDTGTVDAPEPTDTWWAQVRFWLQRDIVNAIVALNEEAAAEAKKNKADRWVGMMPVKEIISIRFSNGYVLANEDEFLGNPPGGDTPAYPPAAQRSAFTHSASDDFVDVMQFTLKLVMDQRDIPKLVSRLTAGRFHTPLRIAYKAIPPNRKMVGKIYGPGPVVNVVMDFETPMLGNIFRKWMPSAICEEFEISCPVVEETGTEG